MNRFSQNIWNILQDSNPNTVLGDVCLTFVNLHCLTFYGKK